MLRNNASGPEIGFPGRIVAGLLTEKHRRPAFCRPEGRFLYVHNSSRFNLALAFEGFRTIWGRPKTSLWPKETKCDLNRPTPIVELQGSSQTMVCQMFYSFWAPPFSKHQLIHKSRNIY
jgi:hypothetical protein